jgi:hypothetical protein
MNARERARVRCTARLVCAALLLLAAAPAASPAGLMSGSRSATDPNQIVATASWGTGFSVSWNITQVGPLNGFEVFRYAYEIFVPKVQGAPGGAFKAISHFILGVSQGFKVDLSTTDPNKTDIFNYSSGNAGKDFKNPTSAQDWGSQGNSNPNIPSTLFGLKFEKNVDPSEGPGGYTYKITFDSYRAPVWGSFYAKDGKAAGIDVTAWNAAFNGPLSGTTVGDPAGYIATPDTRRIPVVPEPSALAIAGLGILGFGGYALRKRARRGS